jgi:2-polyprenyl-3-methyl-5-hydroxy-6-metoxy-1,4-benzoquinol methylase
MLWLDPAPVEEDLVLAYAGYYTHEANGREAPGILKASYRLFARAILAMSGVLAERRYVDSMFLGGLRPTRLLDVGCGNGRFLTSMATLGWSVMGVDFDPGAVAAAKTDSNLDVHVGGIESVAEEAEFDVITASHVIEHVRDPVRFLSECRRRVKPGGLVIIRTPNAQSLGIRWYGANWRGLEPPRHLCIFSMSALKGAARKAGLVTDRCFTSFAMSESVLIVSHLIKKNGNFDPKSLGRLDYLTWKVLGPLFGVVARLVWAGNKSSGEEICAIFRRAA